jgi:hypothetical protein
MWPRPGATSIGAASELHGSCVGELRCLELRAENLTKNFKFQIKIFKNLTLKIKFSGRIILKAVII